MRFCSTLERYWTRFANNWDVLLHGNPAADVYHGLKLYAGGELGIGVGEEEWGSGEREVFEDFAGRTEGLVDMMVSRFAEPSSDQVNFKPPTSVKKAKTGVTDDAEPWMGMGAAPGPADGVVFSGMGAISRASLCNIADWMQQIYSYGEQAYGVKDSPGSERRRRRRKEPSNGHAKAPSRGRPERKASTREYPTIPPPIVTAVERSLERASAGAQSEMKAEEHTRSQQETKASKSPSEDDGWTKYLTLGYGSAWGPGSGNKPQPSRKSSSMPPTGRKKQKAPEPELEPESSLQYLEPEPEGRRLEDRINAQVNAENNGHFIIGLKGGLEDELEGDDGSDPESAVGSSEWNRRTLLRTLYVEVLKPPAITRQYSNESDISGKFAQDGKAKPTRLRVVVYVVCYRLVP